MIRYQSAVSIGRPPGVVFPYLVERDKQALWSDVPMRPLSELPFGPGYQFEVSFGMGPIRTAIALEITELEVDRRLVWRTVSNGPIRWSGEYRVEPEGESESRMSQSGELRFGGLWRLLEPIAGAEIRTGEIQELERLKEVVEAS